MQKKLSNSFMIGVLSIAAALTHFGCAPRYSGQDIGLPVEVPAAFSDSGTDVLPDQWWRAFEDAALETLIEEGLTHNFTLRSAWDRLRQAEQIAVRTGTHLLPSVTYQGDVRRTRREVNNQTQYATDYEIGLAASYEVDLWGRIHTTRQAALLDARAARDDVTAAAITLSAAIGRTWYQLSEAQLQDALIAEQVRTNEQVLEIITLQFRQGQVDASNVFRQRQLVEATRGQLITVREQIGLLTHQLALLVGKAPGQWQPPQPDGLVRLPALPETGIPPELVRRRPDVRSAAEAVAAADARVHAAMTDQYPRIGLSAAISTGGPRVNDIFSDWAGTLAANVVGPLFDAGARRAETERTRAVLSERINTYAQRTLEAVADVQDALLQEHHQRQQIDNLQDQLALAEQVYDRTRESYLKGRLDYLRVLDALVSRQTLQRNELAARRLLIERRIALCRALAGGWTMQPPPQTVLTHDDTLPTRTEYD